MKRHYPEAENPDQHFEMQQYEFAKWVPMLRRIGLKPRRLIKSQDAIFFGTSEGWYRLSLVSYPKEELKWLRGILEYLEERSFRNWAVPWQKTIIWEDNGHCYLIQPWFYGGETFSPEDPAALSRIAEVLADFHRSGRDYREAKGMEIMRDRWRYTELSWETDLHQLEEMRDDAYHEKSRKSVAELKKKAVAAIREAIANWRNSGIHSLLEHQFRSGIISHGNFAKECIVWRDHDYYFLDWENLSFQPRIFDLATLIASIGVWESDWMVFFIREYSRLQPFWTEEHAALLVLLKYPYPIIKMLASIQNKEFDHKNLKEVDREMAKKERCLTKVWRELGSPQRWVWGKPAAGADTGKMALSLSPVESWGDFTSQLDSLIQVNSEHRLPKDVLERLTYQEADRVYGSREGYVLDAAAQVAEETDDIDETPPGEPREELEIGVEREEPVSAPVMEAANKAPGLAVEKNGDSGQGQTMILRGGERPLESDTFPRQSESLPKGFFAETARSIPVPPAEPVSSLNQKPQPALPPAVNPVMRWSNFPKATVKR